MLPIKQLLKVFLIGAQSFLVRCCCDRTPYASRLVGDRTDALSSRALPLAPPTTSINREATTVSRRTTITAATGPTNPTVSSAPQP